MLPSIRSNPPQYFYLNCSLDIAKLVCPSIIICFFKFKQLLHFIALFKISWQSFPISTTSFKRVRNCSLSHLRTSSKALRLTVPMPIFSCVFNNYHRIDEGLEFFRYFIKQITASLYIIPVFNF